MKKRLLSLFAFAFGCFSVFAGVEYEQGLKGENLPIGTVLTWSTAMEENNVVFIIEKSQDGQAFLNIGSVDAAFNEDEEVTNYNFLDIMTNEENSFYRLKQVDQDGTYSYSEVIKVSTNYSNNFMVARMSDVTVTNEFTVSLDVFQDGELNYKLLSWKGDEMVSDQMIVVNGLNDLYVDMSIHNEGIYKLILEMNGEEETLVIKKVLDDISSKPNVASKNTAPRRRN